MMCYHGPIIADSVKYSGRSELHTPVHAPFARPRPKRERRLQRRSSLPRPAPLTGPKQTKVRNRRHVS